MGLNVTRSIDREAARVGIDRAVAVSVEMDRLVCVAVLDAAGHLISYDRMDGAPFQSAQLAQDKAYSVVGNGQANDEFWDRIKDDPWLVSGVVKVPGLVWLGGGAPVVVDGEVVGAVGVSGRSNMTEDRAIADAAIAAIEEALR
jgi:uncharacterized protein GlcG (DUF336 family)